MIAQVGCQEKERKLEACDQVAGRLKTGIPKTNLPEMKVCPALATLSPSEH
jgi:hypothetical protein